MVQTCDNMMELGLDYTGVWEKFKFQLFHCFDVATTECLRAFSWSTKNLSISSGSQPALLQQCNSESSFVRFKKDL
jgi:hypothetical protein